VNFLPATVVICPAFLQLAPAFTAACALSGVIKVKTRVSESRILFIGKVSRVNQRIATI
jgi:uncharacterized membrane protein